MQNSGLSVMQSIVQSSNPPRYLYIDIGNFIAGIMGTQAQGDPVISIQYPRVMIQFLGYESDLQYETDRFPEPVKRKLGNELIFHHLPARQPGQRARNFGIA
jgi:hypothetical protein